MAKQEIPCRVCGKLFEPCAYCKAHEDVFRWRNFACSKECASKYIEDTIAYRETIRNKSKTALKHSNEKKGNADGKVFPEKNTATKSKMKKFSENIYEMKTEENKTE